MKVTVQIFTVSGKLVKTIKNTIFSTGNRSSEVQWDGRDDYGSKIGRGVYIYRLHVRTADGKSASKIEKLYIL
jgi:flagellar hook assembly protein FlgD